jgi:hypothetical protein
MSLKIISNLVHISLVLILGKVVEPVYKQSSNPTQSIVPSVRSLTRGKGSSEYTTKYLSSVDGSNDTELTCVICTTEERDSNI